MILSYDISYCTECRSTYLRTYHYIDSNNIYGSFREKREHYDVNVIDNYKHSQCLCPYKGEYLLSLTKKQYEIYKLLHEKD